MTDLRTFLTEGRLNRRDFVVRAAGLGLSIPMVGALLAACGGDDDDDPAEEENTAVAGGGDPTATIPITVDLNATATPEAEEEPDPEATEEVVDEPEATEEPAPTGTQGGSVTFLREGDADLYDPVLNDSNNTIWVIFSVYECLVKANPEGTGIDPGIAEEWEITDDAMTATFHLRPGVKFSDGSDLTTEDVIWSLERARDTAESAWSFSLAQVTNITAPDDSTIVVELSEPFAPFFAAIAMFNSSIVSKAYFEANAVPNEELGGVLGLLDTSMGTGPFAITEWAKTEYTVLTRNEHYWQEGKPHLDEIRLETVPDTNSMLLQLQGGDVDGVIGQLAIPFNRVADLQEDENLEVIISPAAYNYYARVNMAYQGLDEATLKPFAPRPPFDDIHTRLAMAHAIDYQALIDTVQFGIAEPSHSILPKGALYWNPDQTSPEFDLEKAREEMALCPMPDGFEAEVIITTGNAQQEAIATALQAMWAEINVELLITPLETSVARDRERAGDFDVRLGGWTNDMIDPDQILSYFVLPESSGNARTGYHNEEAAELVIAARGETDDAARREMYYRIQELWLEGPLFYLFNIPYIAAVGTHVKGYHQNPLGPWYFVDMSVEA
jgi:peptide/nickel transport system substrate-binding protein